MFQYHWHQGSWVSTPSLWPGIWIGWPPVSREESITRPITMRTKTFILSSRYKISSKFLDICIDAPWKKRLNLFLIADFLYSQTCQTFFLDIFQGHMCMTMTDASKKSRKMHSNLLSVVCLCLSMCLSNKRMNPFETTLLWLTLTLYTEQSWLPLMSSSNDLGLTFKFWALSSRLEDMFLEVIPFNWNDPW